MKNIFLDRYIKLYNVKEFLYHEKKYVEKNIYIYQNWSFICFYIFLIMTSFFRIHLHTHYFDLSLNNLFPNHRKSIKEINSASNLNLTLCEFNGYFTFSLLYKYLKNEKKWNVSILSIFTVSKLFLNHLATNAF